MTTPTAPAAEAPQVTLSPEQIQRIGVVVETNAALTARNAELDALLQQMNEQMRAFAATQHPEGGARGVRHGFTPVGAGPEVGDRYAGYSPATIQLANALVGAMRDNPNTPAKVRSQLGAVATPDLQASARSVSSMAHRSNGLTGRRVRFNTDDEDGYGAELADTCPADEFWDGALCTSDIMGLFPEAPVKGGKIKYLAVSALPVAYAMQKATDCEGLKCTPDTRVGTEPIEAEAGKLKMKLCMPLEFTEDAFLDVVEQYTEIAQRAIQIINEFVIVRGDATLAGETNINNFGAAIEVVGENATPDFTVFDGLAHATLVDNTNNNGAETDWWTPGSEVDPDHVQKLKTLMADEALKQQWGFCGDGGDLVAIMDFSTYAALTQHEDVKFCDKNCDSPTLQSGQLASLYGVPLVPTAALPLTNIDGVIDMDTPANNVYGQLHLVNVKGFKVGKAADLDIETTVNKDCDLVEVIFRWRLAFARHSSTGNAGGIEAIASLYGIAFAPAEEE